MKTTSVIFAVFILFVALSMNPNVEAGGIDWGKVDPLCTVSCAGYWLCMAKGKDCKRPKKCVCEEFAG